MRVREGAGAAVPAACQAQPGFSARARGAQATVLERGHA